MSNTETEIWKDIEGYEGKYQVSNMGRVKSLSYNKTGKEQMLKQIDNSKGYLYVSLYKNNVGKRVYTHRLVAQAFIANPDNKPCIDHINTIRTDNRAVNLHWVTVSENVNNPITVKKNKDTTVGMYKGEDNPMYGRRGRNNPKSIPIVQLNKDGKFIKEWDSAKEVYRELGIDCSTITKCCRGKKRSCGGFRWKYKNKAV